MVLLGHSDLIGLLGVEYIDAAKIDISIMISFVDICMLLAVEIYLFILK